MRVLGSTLKVGDTIVVWWKPGRDTIVAMRPYTGPLTDVFTKGATIAEFALLPSGMTIDHGAIFDLLSPLPKDPSP